MYATSVGDGTSERGRTAERHTVSDREHSPSKRKGKTKRPADLTRTILVSIASTAVCGGLLFVFQRQGAETESPVRNVEKSASSSTIAAQQALSIRTLTDHAQASAAMNLPLTLENFSSNTPTNILAETDELSGHEQLKNSLEKEFKSSLKKAKRDKKMKERTSQMLRSMFPDGHIPDVPGVDHELTHNLEEHMHGHYPELPVLEMERKLREGGVAA